MNKLKYTLDKIFSGSIPLLIFARLVETFLVCIIPSYISVKILQHVPIRNLMYALYGVSMAICYGLNIFYWAQFMRVIRDWTKYIIINLGTYMVFCVIMLAGYYMVSSPTMYTSFFGAYRALEFFGLKTRYSLWILNLLSVVIIFLTGMWANGINKKEESGEMMYRMDRTRRHRLGKRHM